MTNQAQPAPPKRSTAVMRVFNNVPKLLLRSPLHGLMSKNVLLLTFTGRKSGKRYTLPLSYVQSGEQLLLGTETPWWKNLRGGVPVTIRLRGEQRTGRADVVTDEHGMREAYRTILTLYPGYGRFIDVALDPDGQPNAEAVARGRARGLVVIRIQLDPPGTTSQRSAQS